MKNGQTVLAGELTTLGNAWLTTLANWADMALPTALGLIVVVTMARKMSMRAGVGALIMFVIALAIYGSRFDLANIFKDEVDHPGDTGMALITKVVSTPASALPARDGAA